MSSEQVRMFNQIMQMIDEKATSFKDNRFDMRAVQADSEKKLLLDLIDQALTLAGQMSPAPEEAVRDLKTLQEQFYKMN